MSDPVNVNSVKVGDVRPWNETPVGAMVLRRREDGGAFFYVRLHDGGWCVGSKNADGSLHYYEEADSRRWPWDESYVSDVAIIALGLTGQESATELQRMAEVFGVREALILVSENDLVWWDLAGASSVAPVVSWWDNDELVRRLHTAGWRPGMTAEDAARLLAEASKTRTE